MRKLNKGRKFSMEKGPRLAMFRTMSNSFFMYEKIQTTEAKAKELRTIVEPMITRAKTDTVANRRILAGKLTPKMITKIFKEIAPLYKDRQGGYTRIIKLGPRNSDSAKMAIIELVK
jgi:large subunit ribosomal protein L17